MSEESENKILHDVQQIRQQTGFEKYFQTVLLGLIMTGILWLVNRVQDSNERLIKMEERERMKEQQVLQLVNSVNKLTTDMYELKERMTKFELNNKNK